jgi:hypothetical protein
MSDKISVLRTQKIIWIALAFSHVVHLVLGLFVLAPTDRTAEDVVAFANGPIPIAMFAIGLMQIGFGAFVIPQVVKVPSDQGLQGLTTQRIIQWALMEAGVVIGLVCSALGGASSVLVGLYVVALLAMMKTFPASVDIVVPNESDDTDQ